jgi:hypothetical protein
MTQYVGDTYFNNLDEVNPVTKPTLAIELNDASFLAIVLDKWINENDITPTPTMNNLLKKLQGKELC